MQNLSIATAVTGFLAVVMVSCQVAYGIEDQALVEAAHNNDLKQLQQLLSQGINVNLRDRDGVTPLIEASVMAMLKL